MIVAFFDFDGTISTKDSFIDFVTFSKGKLQMLKGVLRYFWTLIGYKFGLVSGHSTKEILLTYYYKGYSEKDFQELGRQYVTTKIKSIIRPKALERILWHKAQGHQVVVVTASIAEWIKPWCKQLEIQCIATELEVIDGLITGKLKGKNCIGEEKVNRIEKEYDIKKLEYIYSYGNSKGDNALLGIADEKYYRFF